jgi:hypothetical protein
MKILLLVLSFGFFVPLCLGVTESEIDPNRVLSGTYLKFFLYPNDYEKRDFLKAEEALSKLDPDAPFPELIKCLREYIEGDYPRALFLLSKAEGKLGESKKYDFEANGSASQSFSMAAHFSYLKLEILSKIGRREEACEERSRFIMENLFFVLGYERKTP